MADKTLEVESKQKLEINESEAILAEYNKTRDEELKEEIKQISDHPIYKVYKTLQEVQKAVVSFHFEEFFALLEAAKSQAPDLSHGDAIIILIGKTGTGKSTTI